MPYRDWYEEFGYRNSERSFIKEMGPFIAGLHATVLLVGFILWSIMYVFIYFNK